MTYSMRYQKPIKRVNHLLESVYSGKIINADTTASARSVTMFMTALYVRKDMIIVKGYDMSATRIISIHSEFVVSHLHGNGHGIQQGVQRLVPTER